MHRRNHRPDLSHQIGNIVKADFLLKEQANSLLIGAIQNVGSEAQQEAESNNENGLLAAAESIAYFAALIAVNLSVMNLLPLPALDGGRILFLLVDAVAIKVFHRKIPERFQAAVNAAGMALLLGFMLLVTFQDVFKLVK